MHLREYKTILKQNKNSFFGREAELDEDTFFMWKEELQKELPTFWEDMGGIS